MSAEIIHIVKNGEKDKTQGKEQKMGKRTKNGENDEKKRKG